MALFKITVSGFETAEEDLEKEQKGIESAAAIGLRMVESQFYTDLQRHIQKDWYEAWGDPKMYVRRTDDDALGTPLGDMEENAARYSSIDGLTLSFIYSPTGQHDNSAWSLVDGDKLIEIIQTNSGWKWKPDKDSKKRTIMPRPFWNNFVEEEFNGGAFAAFDYGFSGRGYDLISEGVEKDLEHAGGESLLDAAEDYDLPM